MWKYPGVQTLSKQTGENLLALHPIVKPTAMVADAILDCTTRGDVVVDALVQRSEESAASGAGPVPVAELDQQVMENLRRRMAKFATESNKQSEEMK